MKGKMLSVATLGVAGLMLLPAGVSAADNTEWQPQDSRIGKTLKGVAFVDDCHGWAVGDAPDPNEGTDAAAFDPLPSTKTPILVTRNGGRTWKKQNSHLVSQTLNRVQFVDTMHGWAVGEPPDSRQGTAGTAALGAILATTDGGTTWTDQSANAPNASYDYEGISFVSRRRGWLAASPGNNGGGVGAILRTTNGGATYVAQALPKGVTEGIADVYFVDMLNGWAVDDAGNVLHTTNGGVAGPGGWTIQSTIQGTRNEDDGILEAVAFYNKMLGVAVGADGLIMFTTDGGASWDPSVIAGGTDYSQITFTDVSFPMKKLVALTGEPLLGEGVKSTVLVSRTGGVRFTPQYVNSYGTLSSIAFARGSDDGWAVGDFGAIVSNDPDAWKEC